MTTLAILLALLAAAPEGAAAPSDTPPAGAAKPRTRATGAVINHGTPGFSTQCRSCHTTWRFSPATFPAHQTCFDIRGGPHAGVKCMDCHSSIPPVDVSQPLTCNTDTADCMRCHGTEASRHVNVPGYAPVNRKCYECHRFAPVP